MIGHQTPGTWGLFGSWEFKCSDCIFLHYWWRSEWPMDRSQSTCRMPTCQHHSIMSAFTLYLLFVVPILVRWYRVNKCQVHGDNSSTRELGLKILEKILLHTRVCISISPMMGSWDPSSMHSAHEKIIQEYIQGYGIMDPDLWFLIPTALMGYCCKIHAKEITVASHPLGPFNCLHVNLNSYIWVTSFIRRWEKSFFAINGVAHS